MTVGRVVREGCSIMRVVRGVEGSFGRWSERVVFEGGNEAVR